MSEVNLAKRDLFAFPLLFVDFRSPKTIHKTAVIFITSRIDMCSHKGMVAALLLIGIILGILSNVDCRCLSLQRVADGSPLRLCLSVITPSRSEDIPCFRIALENAGDKDLLLNLGYLLANGKRQIPSAILLLLTDSSGRTREAHYYYWSPSMRLDDYVVPLRSGSTYSLTISLDRIVWSGDYKPRTSLDSGEYRIRAEFRGEGAKYSRRDDVIGVMTFWKGTLQSDEVAFQIR